MEGGDLEEFLEEDLDEFLEEDLEEWLEENLEVGLEEDLKEWLPRVLRDFILGLVKGLTRDGVDGCRPSRDLECLNKLKPLFTCVIGSFWSDDKRGKPFVVSSSPLSSCDSTSRELFSVLLLPSASAGRSSR